VASIPSDKLDLRTYGTSAHNKSDAADLAAWAARDDWFIAKGFRMQDCVGGATEEGEPIVNAYPWYKEQLANKATKAFFGLSVAENNYLFGDYPADPHPLAAVLIDRIDNVIRGYIPPEPEAAEKESA